MASIVYITVGKLIELLQSASKKNSNMHVRIASKTSIELGEDPINPLVKIDLSREVIIDLDEAKSNTKPLITKSPPTSERAVKPSGKYWIIVRDKTKESKSLRDLLKHSLLELEKINPGTLEKLASISPRSKRIVAKDRRKLFQSEHMVLDHSSHLCGPWWYGTNNSAKETRDWIKKACECAGLVWGKDVKSNIAQ